MGHHRAQNFGLLENSLLCFLFSALIQCSEFYFFFLKNSSKYRIHSIYALFHNLENFNRFSQSVFFILIGSLCFAKLQNFDAILSQSRKYCIIHLMLNEHYGICILLRFGNILDWSRARERDVLVRTTSRCRIVTDWLNATEFDHEWFQMSWYGVCEWNTHVGRTKRVEAMLRCYHTRRPRALNRLLFLLQRLLIRRKVACIGIVYYTATIRTEQRVQCIVYKRFSFINSFRLL